LRNIFHDIKTEAFKPFVLGLLEYHQQGAGGDRLSDSKLIEILKHIRTYLIRRRILVLSQGENKSIVLLCDRINKLSNSEVSMLDLLSNQFYKTRLPNDNEVSERLQTMDFYNDAKKYARFILGKIEEHNSKVAVNFRDSKITIEHIMPQTLSSLWKHELGSNYEDIHKKYLNSIGNLILTEFNGEIGNKSFSEKKEKIRTSNLTFRLDIIDRDTWTDADIEEHKRNTISCFLQTFPLPTNMKTNDNWNTSVKEKDNFSPLDNDAGEIAEGNKPAAIIINSVTIPVKSWQEVFIEFLKWVKNSEDYDFETILLNQVKLFGKENTIVKWKYLKNSMYEEIEQRTRYKTFEGFFWDNEKVELTDDLMFIHINSSAKAFINKLASAMNHLGMSESFVEILLK